MRQVRIVVYAALPRSWKASSRFQVALANAWHKKRLDVFKYPPIGVGVEWQTPRTSQKSTAFNAAWVVGEALKTAGVIPQIDDIYFTGVRVTNGPNAKLILTLEE